MKHIKTIISVCFLALSFVACNDVWDEHYHDKMSGEKSELNLYDYINSESDLSIFANMLRISGYNKLLSGSQTYTVWAPNNEALKDVNLADTVFVTNLVKNHIARFLYTTSNLETEHIYMFSDKLITFARKGDKFELGNNPLENADILVQNGILHTLSSYVPYKYNIWEFIGQTQGLDSLKAFLYSQSEYIFDEEHSVEIGTNEFNQSIYDSIIVFSNPILDEIGSLYLEDSLYAAILPNNAAWIKIYEKAKLNFKILPAPGSLEKQRLYTQKAIVENLIFRIPDIETSPVVADSAVSTTGSVFKTAGLLFENTIQHNLSNGIAYVADSLVSKPSETWQKPIIVEAENSDYGRLPEYCNIKLQSSVGSIYNVSKKRYLWSEPTEAMTPNAITFPIPNTLSGKYRIYCVFVPSSVVQAADTLRKYKVQFNVSYLNASGKQIVNAAISSTNKILTTTGSKAADFETTPGQISKMFVAEIDLPYCNLLTKESTNSDINFKLKVSSSAKATETVKYDRSMRIDYIILEPVQ